MFFVADSRRRDVGAFYIFHEAGITIVESDSCQTLRLIDSEETMPGLLRQVARILGIKLRSNHFIATGRLA